MGGESRGMFDLRKQFVFYASYHNQPVNVAIHLVCIWNLREYQGQWSMYDITMVSMLSVWSGMVLMHHSPQLATAPELLTKVMTTLTMMMTMMTMMMRYPRSR